MNKCKGCKWYGKPYWSIINPCDNCLRENTNVEIPTIGIVDGYKKEIEELKHQLQQKENIIKEVREYIKNNTYKIEWGDLEQDNEDINISEDLTEKEFIESLLGILDKGE